MARAASRNGVILSPVFSKGQYPSKGPSVSERTPTAMAPPKEAREMIEIGAVMK